MTEIGRRSFLRTAAGAALGAGLGGMYTSWQGTPVLADEPSTGAMPTRRLGKIGYEASVFSLGGMTTIMERDSREDAAAIIHRALELGVNYIDTADSYRAGDSESNIGDALEGRRDEVFLATKTRQRSLEGLAEETFERTCERLKTDYVDLYFLHAVQDLDDLDTVLDRENGTILAFERLRDAGRIGNIGISSHSSSTLMAAMERYDFDCVFVTMNPAGLNMNDPENLRDMLAMAQDKDIGAVGMKIPSRGGVLDRGITMEEAMGYALSLPIATANIGISTLDILEENVKLAKAFKPLEEEQLAELERRALA